MKIYRFLQNKSRITGARFDLDDEDDDEAHSSLRLLRKPSLFRATLSKLWLQCSESARSNKFKFERAFVLASCIGLLNLRADPSTRRQFRGRVAIASLITRALQRNQRCGCNRFYLTLDGINARKLSAHDASDGLVYINLLAHGPSIALCVRYPPFSRDRQASCSTGR